MKRSPFALALLLLVTACGGGGGTNAFPPNAPLPTGGNTVAGSPAALPTHYSLVDLGANNFPNRINNLGAVVGRANVNINAPSGQAFLYQNGKLILLAGAPGSTISNAADINDSGIIVGGSGNSTSGMATEFHVGMPGTALGNPPGNDNSYATSVNNSGEIVGQAFSSTSTCGSANGGQNVARFDGTPAVLTAGLTPYVTGSGTVAYAQYSSPVSSCTTGILSAARYPSGYVNLPSNACDGQSAYSQPSDVDEAGDIVGNYSLAQPNDCRYNSFDSGFLTTATGSSEVDGPGGIPATVNGLNSNLWVVGYTANGAFVWAGGNAEYLQPTLPASCDNWFLLQATDINNGGDVVGIGQVNGVYHGFLLKPE